VVRAVYDEDVKNPAAWLVELVAKDIADFGLVREKKSSITHSVTFSAEAAARFETELRLLERLEESMASVFGDGASFAAEVKQAIKSRTLRQDDSQGSWY
jgi:hypothetical protein